MEKIKNNKKVLILVMIGVFVVGIIGFVCLKNNKEEVVDVESFEVERTGDVEKTNQDSQVIQENQSKTEAESPSNQNQIYIHIIGEVNNQGVIILEKGQRIIDQTTPNMIQRISGIFERKPLISKEI